ncbi:hypothetical protein [Actinophytocola glycyrrhizae]|uniref:Integral membrane protein n=1 Tax=Actinophytocola glycyrrhizae TaxID=2044873 RepID=A0ABV9RRJ6_9PSEU
MSQPYGQQPGDFNQGHGAMPPAPPEYSSGPVTRPGTVTTAAVLAFVQAGITLICSVIMMIGLGAIAGAMDDAETIGGIDVDEGMLAGLWIVTIVGLIGAGLLIWGGVKALSGTAGQLLVIAAGLQILLCVIWLAAFQGGIVSIILVVMPIIILVMSLGGPAKQYEASRSGRA